MFDGEKLVEYSSISEAYIKQARGTISRVRIELEQDELYVFLIKGHQEGPRVWVQAALHGDEYDGIITCLELLEQYPSDCWSGDLIVSPIVNPSAFLSGTNASPQDRVNMNRVFSVEHPGSSYSYLYGAGLLEQITSFASYFIDLHGGGKYLDVCPFAMLPAQQDELNKRTLEILGEASLVGILNRSDATTCMLIDAVAQQGIPSVLLESGSGQAAKDLAVQQHTKALLSIFQALGLMKNDEVQASKQNNDEAKENLLHIEQAIEIRFEVDGIQRSQVAVGTVVKRGDVLLEVTSYPSYRKQQIVCEVEQAIVLSIHTASLVRKHDYAAMLAII